MDFDAYTLSIGFSKYYGMEDYPDQKHFDGSWGIYDDKFLNFFGDKLDQNKKPFLSVLFTLSSHQPYSIPKEFQGTFPKGTLEIHESIGYVDESLRLFFEKNKNKDWFENTLFVITADHTQKTKGLKFNSTLGKYRVPLFFYHPNFDFKEVNSTQITQHVDILPSVLDFLDLEQDKNLLYGRSVMSSVSAPILNSINGSYILIKDNQMIRMNGEKATIYDISDDLLTEKLSRESGEELEVLLKSYIQYSINGLIRNDLYR
jgi:uncharacterized sulfatase